MARGYVRPIWNKCIWSIIKKMITFYFNSNLPEYYTGDLCEVFDNLMLKFILLLNDKKLPINGYIATNNQPSTILICGKTLKSLIDNYPLVELK